MSYYNAAATVLSPFTPSVKKPKYKFANLYFFYGWSKGYRVRKKKIKK